MRGQYLWVSPTNFSQTACIELAIQMALLNKSSESASPSSDSEEMTFKTLRITGIAAFTCSKCLLWMETKTENKETCVQITALAPCAQKYIPLIWLTW